MSVARLTNRTTFDRSMFIANQRSEYSLLLLSETVNVETFALEFTVGDAWSEKYSVSDNQMFRLHADVGLALHPLGSVVIETNEFIAVPNNLFGFVVPTGSLFLDRGVIMAAAKIEPGFEGKLRLRLVNTGDKVVRLNVGDKLASGVFFDTADTVDVVPVKRGASVVDRGRGRTFEIALWLKKNHMQLIQIIMVFLGSAVLSKVLFD